MFTKEKFYEQILNAIVDILDSYVKLLNELIFILSYQPDKSKAYTQVTEILSKFNKVKFILPGPLVKMIFQYLMR